MLAGACGGAAALAGCSSRSTSDGTPADGEWVRVESPTEMTLFDAAATRRGPVAVGEGGRVVRRSSDGWRLELTDGPTGAREGLRGADATANGRRVWFCGDSGVVGRYDVLADEFVDVSAPKGKTSTWEDVAVAGLAGQEWMYLVNGSGELLRGRHGGDGTTWRDPVKPASGSSALAVAFPDRGTGYVCDTSGTVAETVDAGEQWRRIGVDGAGVDLHDVAPWGADAVTVAGGNGVVFEYDGLSWSSRSTGGGDVHAVARTRRDGLAADASGDVYELTRRGWTSSGTPTETPLHGVVLDIADAPAVAVGAGGTVLERPR